MKRLDRIKSWLVWGCLLFPAVFLSAGTVRLINNSPYQLRAVVRGGDGSFLSEMIIQSQKESIWTDTSGSYGFNGGANEALNQNYRSRTPYTVLWYCMSGSDYGVCDNVSTGGVVTAQGCIGTRMCRPQQKGTTRDAEEGNFLYQPSPLTQ